MKSFNQTLQYNALSHYLNEFELLLNYIYKFLVTILQTLQITFGLYLYRYRFWWLPFKTYRTNHF